MLCFFEELESECMLKMTTTASKLFSSSVLNDIKVHTSEIIVYVQMTIIKSKKAIAYIMLITMIMVRRKPEKANNK